MSEKYQDFQSENVVWNFDRSGDIPVFKKFHLKSMVAGDTDSCYVELPKLFTKDKTIEKIVDDCDDIGEKLNASFPSFVMDIFNCPESRKNTIKTDREAISDKSFFLTKKRYIMHLVNMEGKWVDKLKIVGVEIKKSDTSYAIKTMLMELVNAFLDGMSMADVDIMIRRMKSEFRERFSMLEIAKPMSCKTLKKAEGMYAMTGSKKGIHYAARASMYYNRICTSMDRRIYSGDKIKLIYIVGGEENYIALPGETKEMPEWWCKDFKIDYKTEWDNAYTKISNYLAAMGWDIQSRKDKIKKDLFGF